MQQSHARGVRRILPGQYDAEVLARTLAASGHAWCWLDGEAPTSDEASVSYFGVTEQVLEASRGHEREFLHQLRSTSDGDAVTRSNSDVPAAFFSGWVTALSYELGVALLGLDPAADDALPGFALKLDAVLALEGARLELRADTTAALDGWMSRYGQLVVTSEGHIPLPAELTPASSAPSTPGWRRSGAEYEAQVAACQRAIVAGDAYVMCLTDIASLEGRFEPVTLYARMRSTGAAARGGVICAGDRALVSASPERFLSVRGSSVATLPIKGTRPRSADRDRDRAFALELESDPKERAENLMIVDLMRNDLSRVCEPGSVGVRSFLRVESHPHVHQLVSTVVGQLCAGLDVIDVLEACFPGGSMTGAPKHRVVELLGELEAAPRGLYSGCFGWIDAGGDAELAMTIRGVELRGLSARRQVALIGAGGGVTADSDPARERAEKDLKAASIFTAL